MQNLKELLKTLLKEDIDFVLIGGFAAVIHGATLVTQDLDICVAITKNSIFKLRNALKNVNPRHRMNPNVKLSFLEFPKEPAGTNNIYLETDLGVLDILSEVQPAGNFADIKARAVTISIYGFKCQVISVDDLIKVKASMTRPKDLQAVQELELIKIKEKK